MTVTDGNAVGSFTTFRVRPQLLDEGKMTKRLAASDLVSFDVQVLASGGENNLHAHLGEDALWLVLNGEVTFYTTGDQVVAKLGRFEGLLIPRGTPYWFESASSANLVIVRCGARAQNEEFRREDRADRKYAKVAGDGGVAPKRVVKVREGEYFGG